MMILVTGDNTLLGGYRMQNDATEKEGEARRSYYYHAC